MKNAGAVFHLRPSLDLSVQNLCKFKPKSSPIIIQNSSFFLFNSVCKTNETSKLRKWSEKQNLSLQMCWIIRSLPLTRGRKRRGRIVVEAPCWWRIKSPRDNYHRRFIIAGHQPLNRPCSVPSTPSHSATDLIWGHVQTNEVEEEVVFLLSCSCSNQVVMFMRRRSDALHHPSGLLWACSSPDLSLSRGTLWITASVTFLNENLSATLSASVRLWSCRPADHEALDT